MAFFLFFFLSLLSLASSASRVDKKTFIIRVQNEAKPSIFTTHKHWYESSLSSVLSPSTPTQVIHVYDTVFHGFSAQLSTNEALKLQTLPHVIAVIPEQVRYLHTTRSPLFLGLKTTDKAGLLKESDFGSDLVIGVIDTGIWPERQSFKTTVTWVRFLLNGKANVLQQKTSLVIKSLSARDIFAAATKPPTAK